MIVRLAVVLFALVLASPAAARGLLDEAAQRAFWCEAANEEMALNGKLTLVEAAFAQMGRLTIGDQRKAEADRLGLTAEQVKTVQTATRMIAAIEVESYLVDKDPSKLSHDYNECLFGTR